MVKPSPLDDRDTSDIAWARYRRLMKGMAIVSFGAFFGVSHAITAPIGAVVATGVRLAALARDWHLPKAEP